MNLILNLLIGTTAEAKGKKGVVTDFIDGVETA
jgi:hypothetical protein